MILTPLQKLPKNVGDLGKFIVAKCFEWLPKVQKIAQSGHTTLEQEAVSTFTTLACVQLSQLSLLRNFQF